MSERSDELRNRILAMRDEYYQEAFPQHSFKPGETAVRVSGRVFDTAELKTLVDSCLDFVMDRTFWIGVYTGVTEEMIRFVVDRFDSFCCAGSRRDLSGGVRVGQ